MKATTTSKADGFPPLRFRRIRGGFIEGELLAESVLGYPTQRFRRIRGGFIEGLDHRTPRIWFCGDSAAYAAASLKARNFVPVDRFRR